MVCKRHSEGSLRPLQNCLMAWGDMPIISANSTQLTFFPSSLFAAEAATHTFLFSSLFVELKGYKKAPSLYGYRREPYRGEISTLSFGSKNTL